MLSQLTLNPETKKGKDLLTKEALRKQSLPRSSATLPEACPSPPLRTGHKAGFVPSPALAGSTGALVEKQLLLTDWEPGSQS